MELMYLKTHLVSARTNLEVRLRKNGDDIAQNRVDFFGSDK